MQMIDILRRVLHMETDMITEVNHDSQLVNCILLLYCVLKKKIVFYCALPNLDYNALNLSARLQC
jgi:hypothetical protein